MYSWMAGLLSLLLGLTFSSLCIADWQIGDYQMARSHSLPNSALQIGPSGINGLRSYRFVGRVGGVSLEAISSMPDGLEDKDLRLEYRAREQDGARLKVHLSGKSYSMKIYDWQLLPIAKFADSDFTAVVSLFGPMTTKSQFHIIYHPAFSDTLMGLRLLQADTFLIDVAQFSTLPRKDGKLILGAGEKEFSVKEGVVDRVRRLIEGYQIESWVVTDVGRSPKIRVSGSELEFVGKPYFYFWKSELSDEAKPLAGEYLELSLLIDVLKGNPSASSRLSNLKIRQNDLENKISAIDPKVVPVAEASAAVENNWHDIESLNPPVFGALRAAAQYSAFFRLAKKSNQAAWFSFLKSLQSVSVPAVELPNLWPKPRR